MKKFENFIKENIISDKEWLLNLGSYLSYGVYWTKPNNKFQKNIGMLVRNVDTKNFIKTLTSGRKTKKLTYSNFARFLLYFWTYKYNGNNDLIIEIQTILNNNLYEPFKIPYSGIMEAYSKIPTNQTMISNFVEPILGVSNMNKNTDNLSIMKKLYEKRNEIFTEESIINYYFMINKNTERANRGEKEMVNFFSNQPNFTNVRKDESEAGISLDANNDTDLLATYNGEDIYIQVKEPFTGKVTLSDNELVIDGTNLVVKSYSKENKPPWKFLIILDRNNNKDTDIIYQIDADGIDLIVTKTKKISIKLETSDFVKVHKINKKKKV